MIQIWQIGKGILYHEADEHRRYVLRTLPSSHALDKSLIYISDAILRLRKAMSPAFSVAAVRNYLEVFYNSSYKVKVLFLV